MTVLNAVLAAATELDIFLEVWKYLDGSSDAGKSKAESLLRCFNIVENELALDYFPLLAEEEIESETGAIYFSEFSRSIVRVVKVTDEWGNDVPYKLFPEYLKTQAGKVIIRYSYTPAEKTFQDESDFVLHVSTRLFAYGMAAEYALASCMFEAAVVWDKKYKEAIKATYRLLPCKRIKSRRWV